MERAEAPLDCFDDMSPAELALWYVAPPSWVRCAMVVGLDGAYMDAAGSSRGLSGPADLSALRMMRALADVIVVGASTAVREGYVAGHLHPDAAPFAAGPTRLAVVSQTLDLPTGSPMFRGERPLVVTQVSRDTVWRHRLRDVEQCADVIALDQSVTGTAIVAALRERGLAHVLCEGGPTLQQMLRADQCVDEIAVTVTAQIGGCAAVVRGAFGEAEGRYEITHSAQSGPFTFLRCRLLRGVPTLVP